MVSPEAGAPLEAWLGYLESLDAEHVELGLERVRTVLARLKLPTPPLTVTVAGTNGKGSTAALIAAGLKACGEVTGLYTSPHLRSFTERISIEGVPVEAGRALRRPWAI